MPCVGGGTKHSTITENMMCHIGQKEELCAHFKLVDCNVNRKLTSEHEVTQNTYLIGCSTRVNSVTTYPRDNLPHYLFPTLLNIPSAQKSLVSVCLWIKRSALEREVQQMATSKLTQATVVIWCKCLCTLAYPC